MRVLLFGATGNIGTAIARELIARGHAVTAATRGGSGVAGLDVPVRKVDATDPAEVAAAATGQDAIVSAIGPRRGVDDQEAVLVGGARGLIAGARSAGVSQTVGAVANPEPFGDGFVTRLPLRASPFGFSVVPLWHRAPVGEPQPWCRLSAGTRRQPLRFAGSSTSPPASG